MRSSNSRSSTFRRDSGKRMYIITTSRMISGDEWKYRNGLAGLRGRGMASLYPLRCSIASGAILLTLPWRETIGNYVSRFVADIGLISRSSAWQELRRST